jgi:hypothetical protein
MDHYLSHAIILYTGKDVESFPKSDADAVMQEFGEVLGEELLTDMHAGVFKLLDAMPPDWDNETLGEASRRVLTAIVRDYPGLEPRAAMALIWIYQYGWK